MAVAPDLPADWVYPPVRGLRVVNVTDTEVAVTWLPLGRQEVPASQPMPSRYEIAVSKGTKVGIQVPTYPRYCGTVIGRVVLTKLIKGVKVTIAVRAQLLADGEAGRSGSWTTVQAVPGVVPPPPLVNPYKNPFRGCSIQPGRIDQGVDYTCAGAVYALGPSVITVATEKSGWPGGGAVVGLLTEGPLKGNCWYVTEDIRPVVSPGFNTTADTVIGFIGMVDGAPGSWIETGWATSQQPSDVTLATERGDADPQTGAGEWSTAEGHDYALLLEYLGAPAGVLSTPPHGTNPWDSVALMKAAGF